MPETLEGAGHLGGMLVILDFKKNKSENMQIATLAIGRQFQNLLWCRNAGTSA